MILIYRAGFQLTKIKGMMIFAALCAAGAVYWGWDLFNTVGLRPADGGVLKPLGERLAWGLGVAGLGVAFLAGMWVFGRRYATRIRYDQAKDALHIGTLEFLAGREHIHAASDVLGSTYHHGRMEGEGVNAPWFMLSLKGRSRLIVDAQGIFPDRALAERLLKLG
jgi:transmembrane protein TMEM70 (proton-transport ATP synthase complex)